MRLSQQPSPNASEEARRAPAPLSRVHRTVRLIALVLLVLLVGISAGIVLERYRMRAGGPELEQLRTVVDILDDAYYYRPTTDDEEARFEDRLEEQAIVGLLSALDDEYTRYLTEDESQTAAENLQGRFGGTGVEVTVDESQVVVTNVIPGTPADEARILPGDVLEAVDGAPVDAGDLDAVVRRLRGEVGTSVRVTVHRPATGERFQVDMVREEIVVPPVRFQMVPGTSIGWIQVAIFGDQTTDGVDDALRAAAEAHATGIVLDLRGNGGGWVTSAQEVIGRFVDPARGPALYEDTDPGAGGEEALPILSGDVGPTELPVVVLVDRATASAAEIVAGALRDYERAILVGESTFGKGSVQRIYTFPDGATLRVTVAEWFTPSRQRIEDAGLAPDVPVSFEAHATTGEDPVLAAAVELLESGRAQPDNLATPAAPAASPAATPSARVNGEGAVLNMADAMI